MTEAGPPMRRRQLGRQLRELREARGVRREDAAAALDCSQSRISHIETGRYGVRKPDLEVLLRLYGALDRLEELEVIRREGAKRGWWSTRQLPDWLQLYIGYEEDAVAVRTFSLELLPGLIQTEAYAHAIHLGSLSHQEIRRRVDARMKRQSRLAAQVPLELSVVLSEGALMRTIGMGEVGLEVLNHVAAVASERPNVSVHVLPFAAGAHLSMAGSFTLLSFAAGVSLPIAYQEYAVGGHIVDGQDDVQQLFVLYDQLRDKALTSDESLILISELTQRAEG